ncbi:MAG: hypothetical protein ACXVUE_19120 [Solirubrobacteraceae bacterium]
MSFLAGGLQAGIRRAGSRASALVILVVLAQALAVPIGASAASGRHPSLGQSTGASIHAGIRSVPPSGQALAGALDQMTGLTPAQVQLQDVCPPAAPGMARCAAQALILHSTHKLVRPDVARTRPLALGPRSMQPAAATAASTPAVNQPAAGTPAYLQQAYDLSYLSQTGGRGDTVAVVDAYDDPTAESDLGTFRSASGLAACTTANGCFRKVNEAGAASPLPTRDAGWEEEISLDLDAVSALCPNCHILLVEANSTMSTDMTVAMQTAAALGAKQISDSWSVSATAPVGGTYTLPGVDVVAATGDHGYPGAGVDNYPAAFAGVTAAGGTSLSAATNGQGGRGFAESAWSLSNGWGGASGCDVRLPKPLYQSDTGCTGRAYADVSADADPATGLKIYDSGNGGWLLMGGTSLATPLVAAYYGITGLSATTPQWAYTSSALLNDPASGSSGSCAQNILYICSAGVGYDGPTGAGSISGAVVPGAPGIGGPSVGTGTNNTYTQKISSIDATLTGGIYPNGVQTTWWVEYGTSTSYGQHTSTSDVGSGQTLVSLTSTLTGLSPSTTYHYRFVASNSDGTTYGPDSTLHTAVPGTSPPANRTAPTISGDPRRGSPMMALPGSWSGTVIGYVYQWQRSSDGGVTWSSISGATGSTYAPVLEDEGARVRVYVSATGPGGTASAVSSGAGPVAMAPPINTSFPTLSGSAQVGATLTASVGGWDPAAETFTYSWQRSYGSGAFQAIPGATRSTYTVAPNDLGDRIRVVVTATNPDGTAAVASASTTGIAPAPVAVARPPSTTTTTPPPASQAPTPSARALPSLSGGGDSVGAKVTVTRGVFAGAPVTRSITRVMRCTHRCVAVGAPNARTYKISSADAGAVLRVTETASSAAGSITVWAVRSVGPITSVRAGFAVLGMGKATLRGRGGRTLAVVVRHGSVLSIRRPRSSGRARAWACPIAAVPGGPPPRCSAVTGLLGSGKLRLPSGAGGRVRVVVVATRSSR